MKKAYKDRNRILPNRMWTSAAQILDVRAQSDSNEGSVNQLLAHLPKRKDEKY